MNTPEKGGAVTSAEDLKAFDPAQQYRQEKTLGASFARKSLSVNLWLSTGIVMSIALNGYALWAVKNVEHKYFTTEAGRVTEVKALSEPVWSVTDVAQFGADTLGEAFTLDFVHYRDQMTRVMPRFSDTGYAHYYQGLTKSNVLAMVRDSRMNLSISTSPGVVKRKGLMNGVYTWVIQYPVSLKLDGQKDSMPAQRFIIEMTLQRADTREKPKGLESIQMIMTNAS